MSMPGRKAGAHSQTARALRLLERLSGRRTGVTLHELANELGVSERQIRRDLLALDEAGHDVEVGRRDGRSTARLVSASGRSIFVTRRERYTLLSIRRVFDVLRGTPFFEDVESLYGKLAEGFSVSERAEIAQFGERFAYVPDGGTKAYDGQEEVLDALQTGVLNRRWVRYGYRAATGRKSSGVLAPFAIVLYRNGLYAVGHRVGPDVPQRLATPLPAERPFVYAIERFTDAEVVGGSRFEVPPDIRLSDLFEGAFGIFFNGEPVRVVIDFSAELAHRVKARVWHRTQRFTARPGGGVRLEMNVANTTEVVPWVMSFGPHARVVEPTDLAARVREEHRAAAQ
jgi:proteasome accessory factor B